MSLFLLAGCGDSKAEVNNENEIVANSASVDEKEVEDFDVSTDIKKRAKEEGISFSEMETIIDELTEMTASKYGDTADAYREKLKTEGKTPFDEFVVAADYMGVTIKEYYEFEKLSASKWSAEDKETMSAMAGAMEELGNMDSSEFEADMAEAEKAIAGLTGSGDREVTGDYKEIGLYKVHKITKSDELKDAGIYEVYYTSKADTREIIDHFKEFLVGTPGYMCFENQDLGANILGTVNGNQMNINIYNEDGDSITNVEYGYMWDPSK
jgi:hypothetical protein